MKPIQLLHTSMLLGALLAGVLLSAAVSAEELTDYFLVTDHETQEYDHIIWYWDGSVIYGPVRSNDAIAIRGTPRFYDEVITSARDFRHGPGFNPIFFGPDPRFDAEYLEGFNSLPEYSPVLDSLALTASRQGNFFDNQGGEVQTRLVAEEEGWHLLQWPAGVPYGLQEGFLQEDWIPYGDYVSIYVEGNLELFGEHINGANLVGCSGRVRLMDNLTYESFNFPVDLLPPLHPAFLDRTLWNDPLMVLVAGGDILVADTPANGQGNRASLYDETVQDSVSIVITATLYSTSGSFTIEHQNRPPDSIDGSDGYWWCDPQGNHPNQPDERGTIYLLGAVYQRYKGLTKSSGCEHTGYDKEYRWDDRLQGRSLRTLMYPYILYLDREVAWQDTTVVVDFHVGSYLLQGEGLLTLGPGTTLDLVNLTSPGADNRVFQGGRVRFQGTEKDPVTLRFADTTAAFPPMALLTFGSDIDGAMEHVRVEGYGTLTIEAPQNVVGINASPASRILLQHSPEASRVILDSCRFDGGLRLLARVERMAHTVVRGGLFYNEIQEVDHCTFASRDSSRFEDALNGQWGDSSAAIHVSNTVFAGPYWRIAERTHGMTIDYSAWEGFTGPSPFDETVQMGAHNLQQVDPLFWDPKHGDYHLREGSPLIDAADPASPRDPDGSRGDIGAFVYDPAYTAVPEEQANPRGAAREFALVAVYPNPFNGATTVTLTLPGTQQVRVTVYDVLGREVEVLREASLAGGTHRLALDLSDRPSGLYFIRAEAGGRSTVAKAMLVK